MVQPRNKQKAKGLAASLPAAGSSHHAVRRPKLPQGRPMPGRMADPGQQPPATGTAGVTQTDSTPAVTGGPWHAGPHCRTVNTHTHCCALSHALWGSAPGRRRQPDTTGLRRPGKGKRGGKTPNPYLLKTELHAQHAGLKVLSPIKQASAFNRQIRETVERAEQLRPRTVT